MARNSEITVNAPAYVIRAAGTYLESATDGVDFAIWSMILTHWMNESCPLRITHWIEEQRAAGLHVVPGFDSKRLVLLPVVNPGGQTQRNFLAGGSR